MTLEVNVPLAAARADHPHCTRALAWLGAARTACVTGQPLVILPMVAAGLRRLGYLPPRQGRGGGVSDAITYCPSIS